MKLEKYIMKSFFFCVYLVLSLRLATFHGDIGNYTRRLRLLVVCGRATHVVFLGGGELFALIPVAVSADILRRALNQCQVNVMCQNETECPRGFC